MNWGQRAGRGALSVALAIGALAAGAIAWALAILASIATATTKAQEDHRTLLIRWGIALFVVGGTLQFIRESRGRGRARAAEELAEECQSLLETMLNGAAGTAMGIGGTFTVYTSI